MDKTILIIEDETLLLKGLTKKFSDKGFNVLQAWNGEDGLEIALREHPDLVLLDILIPKLDGLSLLKKLYSDEWGKTANIMIISNLEDHKKEVEDLGDHHFEYLIKANWSIDDIVQKVVDAMKS